MSLAILSALPSNPPSRFTFDTFDWHRMECRIQLITPVIYARVPEEIQWGINRNIFGSIASIRVSSFFLPYLICTSIWLLYHDRNLNLLFATFDNAIIQFFVVLYNTRSRRKYMCRANTTFVILIHILSQPLYPERREIDSQITRSACA